MGVSEGPGEARGRRGAQPVREDGCHSLSPRQREDGWLFSAQAPDAVELCVRGNEVPPSREPEAGQFSPFQSH